MVVWSELLDKVDGANLHGNCDTVKLTNQSSCLKVVPLSCFADMILSRQNFPQFFFYPN